MVSLRLSESASDPLAAVDPVAEVLAAHRAGRDLLLRTSGSTAAARPVLRSTASWWDSFAAYSTLSGVGAGARLWVPGPPSATMNLFAAVHARVVGAALVPRPEDATHACLTPALLARRGDELPAGSRVVVAGDALSPAQHATATARGLEVVHYYGAAELSFVAAGAHAEQLRAFPGVQVRAVGGEIRVRSPYVARPGSGALRVDDGWATVGDRGRLDGDRLVVLGRPGTVTTAGATVSPAEVEAELSTVARGGCAIVAVPDPDLGAVLVAVLTDPGDRERLASHARSRLSPAMRPRRWHLVDELPLTPAGKVDRVRLGELVQVSRSDR